MLTLVPTPIGNLKDITLRALAVLKEADAIICEDTRRTGILLHHYEISKPLLVLNDYNEARNLEQIIERLKEGQNLALVSDAGTPLVSDPGYKLVRECIAQNVPIDSLPGPSSVITALTLSGLPPDKFIFLGYPPEKTGRRIKLFENLKLHLKGVKLNQTIIMLVSPHKLLRTLEDIKDVYPDTQIVLAHELTKIHQSVESKLANDWLKELKMPKGEYILLLNLSS